LVASHPRDRTKSPGWGTERGWPFGGAFDQALGEPEPPAQQALAPGHLPGIAFVIEPGQVEQPMKNQHLDFDPQRMSLFTRLAQCRGNADGEIAGDFLSGCFCRRK
jgi:hypothetical protein